MEIVSNSKPHNILDALKGFDWIDGVFGEHFTFSTWNVNLDSFFLREISNVLVFLMFWNTKTTINARHVIKSSFMNVTRDFDSTPCCQLNIDFYFDTE